MTLCFAFAQYNCFFGKNQNFELANGNFISIEIFKRKVTNAKYIILKKKNFLIKKNTKDLNSEFDEKSKKKYFLSRKPIS